MSKDANRSERRLPELARQILAEARNCTGMSFQHSRRTLWGGGTYIGETLTDLGAGRKAAQQKRTAEADVPGKRDPETP